MLSLLLPSSEVDSSGPAAARRHGDAQQCSAASPRLRRRPAPRVQRRSAQRLRRQARVAVTLTGRRVFRQQSQHRVGEQAATRPQGQQSQSNQGEREALYRTDRHHVQHHSSQQVHSLRRQDSAGCTLPNRGSPPTGSCGPHGSHHGYAQVDDERVSRSTNRHNQTRHTSQGQAVVQRPTQQRNRLIRDDASHNQRHHRDKAQQTVLEQRVHGTPAADQSGRSADPTRSCSEPRVAKSAAPTGSRS